MTTLDQIGQLDNGTLARIICRYLLTQDRNAGKFSKSRHCDDAAGDYASEVASYLGLTDEQIDRNSDEFEEIWQECVEASSDIYPSDPEEVEEIEEWEPEKL